MEEQAIIYFDMLPVPVEVSTTVQIKYWGDMIFRKKRMLNYTRDIFRKFNGSKFFHVRNAQELNDLIEHFSLTNYKNYFFINSSFTITDEKLFIDFLTKIQYVHVSLAIYKDEDIKSFLRLEKGEMLSLLGLIKNDPSKVLGHIKIQFDNRIEKFRLENFFIEIRGYLDFVAFLHSNFTPRYFNEIEQKDDVIVKRSADKSKMKMEYSYYHLLPEDLRPFFLPTFGYKETQDAAQYSIERFSIPDLAIQWIHFSMDDHQFEKLIKRLFGFIKARPKRKLSQEQLTAHADNLYLEKVESRLKQLQQKPSYHKLQHIFSSSSGYSSIEALFDRYKTIYSKIRSNKKFAQEQVIGHGDFCFSNILYDKRINLMKLIDPKGSTTLENAYLDEYYDIAKLSHSVLGNYDFINNGLYEVIYDQKLQAQLDIKSVGELQRKKTFFKEFLINQDFDYHLVRVYELSLFLSMTPLHIDNEKNVLAFLINACAIIDEIDPKAI